MASSLSSLGLGSSGVLSYDVIDQLKASDEANQVTPIETKIATNSTKISDLSVLSALAATFKSSTSALADEISYLQRESNVTGDSVNITASAGTSIQEFSMDVTSLAKTDIFQSNSFLSESSVFASGDDTITISIDGEDFEIEIDSGTTISELKDEINDKTDGKVIASILNVGGDNPYKLILKSAESGEDNAISISSTGSSVLDLGLNDYTYTAGTPTGTYGSDTTLTFNVNEIDYTINVASTDTISEINTKINDLGLGSNFNSKVENGILILGSNYSDISVTGDSVDTFGLNSLTNTQDSHIQKASNAEFKFNGVSITRSTNNFDDLIVGVDMTILETGTSNVQITQDSSDIISNLESFASQYNELMSNINESINYDTDTGSSGSFQGVSQITSLKSSINRQLLSIDSSGRSLDSYGLSLNESGYLAFNEDTFNTKLSSNPDDVKDFFVGSTTYNTTIKSGTTISSSSIDLTTNDFSINDVNIELSVSGTIQENALALKKAINDADIYGVKAELDSTNSYIILKSTSGEDISIDGDNSKLSLIGLSTGTRIGTSESTTGVFNTFNDLLANLAVGDDSVLGLYETNLSDLDESLEEEKLSVQEALDAKYEIMANRFIAYDAIIAQLDAQFTSLEYMIEASYSS